MMMILDRLVDLEQAKARNAAVLADAMAAQRINRELRSEATTRLHFFRMYRLRRLFYRVTPSLAERLAL